MASIGADSYASKNYVTPAEQAKLQGADATVPRDEQVMLPDGTIMQGNSGWNSTMLPLGTSASQFTVLDGMTGASVMSMPLIANEGKSILLDNRGIKVLEGTGLKLIHQDGKEPSEVLSGPYRNGFWELELPVAQSGEHTLNAMRSFQQRIHLTSDAERVEFLHATLGFPVVSALHTAVQKGWVTFPGVCADTVANNPPQVAMTQRGHLRLVSQGYKSTKTEEDEWSVAMSNRAKRAERKAKPMRRLTLQEQLESPDRDSVIAIHRDHNKEDWEKLYTAALAERAIQCFDGPLIVNRPPHVLTTSDYRDKLRAILSGRMARAPVALPTHGTDNVLPDSDDDEGVLTFGSAHVVHADATGSFPVTAKNGASAILITYNKTTNYIAAKPFASKGEFSQALIEAVQDISSHGSPVRVVRSDNEITPEARRYLQSMNVVVDVQLVPPHNHRANEAERKIQDFKAHFIAILAGIDDTCPLHFWADFVHQAELTLNMLRPAASGSGSAYKARYGHEHDFNKWPMLQVGISGEIFVPASLRNSTFGQRSEKGWYVGPAMEAYRQYTVRPARGNIRTTDTAAFLPPKAPPKYTEEEGIRQTLQLLCNLLQNSEKFKDWSKPVHDLLALSTSLEDGQHPQRVLESNDEPLAATLAPTHMSTRFPLSAEDSQAQYEQDRVISHIQQPESITADVAPQLVTEGDQQQLVNTQQQQPTTEGATDPSSTVTKDRLQGRRRQKAKKLRPPLKKTDDEYVAAQTTQTTPKVTLPGQFATSKYPPRIVVAAEPAVTRKQAREASYGLKSSVSEPAQRLARMLAEALDEKAGLDPLTLQRLQVLYDNQEQAEDTREWDILNKMLAGQAITYGKSQKGPDADLWRAANAAEWRKQLGEKNTTVPIPHADCPDDRKPSRCTLVLEEKKEGKKRVRAAFNGKLQDYEGDPTARTSSMVAKKLLINKAVSENLNLMTADVSDFFLNPINVLERPEYMLVSRKSIPQETIDEFKLEPMFKNDQIMMKVIKPIYGLKQAARLALDTIVKVLKAQGYIETDQECIFTAADPDDNTTFTLHVDDFCVAYSSTDHLDRLFTVLNDSGYVLTKDMDAAKYCGFAISRDWTARTATLTIPGYVQAMLVRFGLENIKAKNYPHVAAKDKESWQPIQTALQEDASAKLSDANFKLVQEKIGCLRYLASALRADIDVYVAQAGSRIANPTVHLMRDVDSIFAYLKSCPDLGITYKASGMVLKAFTDASFDSELIHKSRSGAYYYLGNEEDDGFINGPIQVLSRKQKSIVVSATEAEYVALFDTALNMVHLRNLLKILGHDQPASTISCDNSVAVGLANGKVSDGRTKHVDRKFHWVREQVAQGMFVVVWEAGKDNLADFFTKHVTPEVHATLTAKIMTQPYTKSNSDGSCLEQDQQRGCIVRGA